MARKKLRNRLIKNTIRLRLPRWAPRVYTLLAVILLPWTIYLGLSLPEHHLSAHWDLSWTGLDIALVASLFATGVLARIKSVWVIISASTTGSLLLVDAWFDIMSERGNSFHQAVVMACLIEIPLAMMSYYLAFHALERNTK
jgi:hypothetical protein